MQSNSNGTPYPRWTQEMLDQFSASVATSIAASNERMTRLEQSQTASNERMDRLEELIEETAAISQATSRDVAHLVGTQEEFRAAMLKLTDLSEGISLLVVGVHENQPTILAKLNRIENKVDRLLEDQA
jgi:ABC-type transporter Mla subunit MlaD